MHAPTIADSHFPPQIDSYANSNNCNVDGHDVIVTLGPNYKMKIDQSLLIFLLSLKEHVLLMDLK